MSVTVIDTAALEAQAAKRVEERARCKTDKMFLAEVMGWDFVPAVHQELFDQFVYFDSKKSWRDQSDIKNRLILWPRGHYKSTAVQVEIVQMILNFPNITILIMRGGLSVTMKLLKEIKAYFIGQKKGSRLHILFPEFCADKLGNSMEFTVPARTDKSIAQATVTVASPNAITTSQHYDAIFFDDLVHQKNFQTKALLAKTEEDYAGAFPLLNPGGYRYVTGTRYARGDLYGNICATNLGEWKISIKTIWADDGISLRFPEQPSPRDSKKTIGFTLEFFEDYRRRYPDKYCTQYLNQPASIASQRFTRQLLMDVLIADDKAPALSRPYLVVDIASGTGPRGDDAVIACGKTDAQRVKYMTDFAGGNWPPELLAKNLLAMVLKHRPVKVMFEGDRVAKVFLVYFQQYCTLKNVNVVVDTFKVDQQKDAKNIRINVLAGEMNTRRFRIFASCTASPLWNKLVDQCENFPGAKDDHDDYPDTMALLSREMGIISEQTLVADTSASPILLKMIEESNKQAAFEALISQKDEDYGSGAGDYIAC